MPELTVDAALIADASLIVRGRFMEAADSFAHVSVRGTAPSTASGFWPAMTAETVDGEYQERYRPSSSATSRMEEVMQGWLLDHVAEIEHRISSFASPHASQCPKWSAPSTVSARKLTEIEPLRSDVWMRHSMAKRETC